MQKSCWRILIVGAAFIALSPASLFAAASPWFEDLSPITAADWDRSKARHLLERAGFGGTPEEVDFFAGLSPQQAVDYLVHFKGVPKTQLPKFEHSGIFEEGIDPFPASRPATTAQAEKTGEALGIKVKASGNRPQQPIVNQFFYWLRASRLETHRIA